MSHQQQIKVKGLSGESDERGTYTVVCVGGIWHWNAVKPDDVTVSSGNAANKAEAIRAAKTFLGWDNGSV